MSQSDQIVVALSKGRIFKETLPLLASVGIEPLEDPDKSRKLILETSDPSVRLLILRASDVPTYVQHGAADIGVAGKDVLMEHGGEGLFELVDLKIAQCKLMVAGKPGALDRAGRIRVATKYTRSAESYFADRGRQIELIKLYGSMELAPLVDLGDCIVDVVDTGNTLRANGLEPLEHIAEISSRLIVNRAAQKLKHARVSDFVERVEQYLEGK
ncbi:ATP phosphoribosyltransferase [Guyparkeria hydrothermalis]|uniref:ATP phosphoribosyltransferase n=1 Tax=Guyparkeria halophila TaxID=47960 RepID=A0A6I6D5G3_9GAMM|nr:MULTISPECIES: ATP phosphoribosyltransferase [Guyparkeria]MCL7750026.1 ATP phosphoribosyltransferase [Guyparkeria hydrothermalis]QGT78631.1 ATP phosphoribosyltransferase [Guyparkeria halophila]TKA89764.1 ATP phosphoribosyltransferase [Guyparkeria sp. SB14A]